MASKSVTDNLRHLWSPKARKQGQISKFLLFQLLETVEQLKAAPPTPSHVAELQQLRGLASEQQRSIQALTLQIQKVETREEALKLEVHRLKDLLEKEARIQKDKEEQHQQVSYVMYLS